MPKAKNLKHLRTKANMTQQAFADAIGASKSTVIAWENKKRAIPVPSARRIADYFDLDYAEFCDVDLERLDREAKSGHLTFTDAEVQSILMFRQLPDNIKDLIRHAILVEYGNAVKHKEK